MNCVEDEEKKLELIASLESVKNWRKQYIAVVEHFVTVVANLPPNDAVKVAETGLNELQNSMLFRTGENQDPIPAREAFFGDAEVVSLECQIHSRPTAESSVPYRFPIAAPTTAWLTGEDAKKQLKAWADYGCMEPSAAEQASRVADVDNATSFVEDKVFVLLGATSAMGPAKSLLQIPGAHVMAVARAGKRMEALVEWFNENGAPGTTLEVCGADLLKEGPGIARWITETRNNDKKQVVVCNLIYMDGEAHVRVSVSMDLVGDYVSEKLGRDRVALSYLTSPATAHPIPEEAALDAKNRFASTPSWQHLPALVPGWLEASGSWDRPGYVYNGLANIQGPNYALAKTMQQWRGMVACWKHQQLVSAPHAPATRTESMVRYDTIASALEGIQYFEPYLSFSVESASSLMTAILLYQVSQEAAKQKEGLKHPMHLFWAGSVHGGGWRCPYSGESLGTLSYMLGKTMKSPFIPPKSVA